jgi:hypothetical protein
LVDEEDILDVTDNDYRLLRGGSFYNPPAYLRAADRYWYVPTHHFRNIGFRVARTVRWSACPRDSGSGNVAQGFRAKKANCESGKNIEDSGAEGKALVSIACGQQAANGFVHAAVERLLHEHPDCRARLSTPRARARIEGAAVGQFDLAIVTDSPTTIRKVAHREMYIEPLFDDHFVLAANPPVNLKSVAGRWSSSLWNPAWASVWFRKVLSMYSNNELTDSSSGNTLS